MSPADPEESRRRHAFVDHVRPGTYIHRTVVVRNTSNRRLRVRLHPGAATVHDGRFQPQEGTNELTGWITLNHPQVDLDAQRETTVMATVRVPRDVSTGERYAVLWAQADPAASGPQTPSPTQPVGSRIYLDVGPGADPRFQMSIGKVGVTRGAGGIPRLSTSVRNTGHRAVDLTGSVRVAGGKGGAGGGVFAVPAGTTLAPGESTSFTVPLARAVLHGSWRATVTVESGTTRATAEAPFTLPELPKPKVAKVSLRDRLVHSLMLTGTGVSLVALGIAVLRYRRACRIRRELRR